MNKINWINGQAGGTPLSAENLNQMQDNIEDAIDEVESVLNEKIKTKYIMASTTTASNLSSDFQVLLNSEERQEGNAFTITNNRVVVGKGVSKVRVSGCIFVEGPQGTGYVWGKIMKNSTNTSTSLQPYNNGGGFLSTSIPPTIVPVTEGDTFRLIADSTVRGNIRISGQATWLLVEAVE